MIKLFSFLSIVLAFGCLECSGQNVSKSRGITEQKAVDMVMNLPEVKKSCAYVRKHSKDKRELFAMIYGEPSKEKPYWWVAIGEDNGMNFVTHFSFLIYVKTGTIKYYDTIELKGISLQAWRRGLASRRY